jgi:PEP-CTERM motif
MSITLRSLFASALFLAFAAGQAQAGQLVLTLDGQTVGSSWLVAGTPIADGTPFEVQADFTDVPTASGTGFSIYSPTAITADVGGTTVSMDFSILSSPFLELFDPSSSQANYTVLLFLEAGNGFGPEYNTATPDFIASSPITTVFSDYVGTYQSYSSLLLPTTSGELLLLGYDPSEEIGLDASLTSLASVPEPGTLAMLGAGLLAMWRLRRRPAR